MPNIAPLIFVGALMFCVLTGITLLAHFYSLNNIKSKTVGDGQHGTARWASKTEIRRIYQHVPFTPERWREQAASCQEPTLENGEPLPQGIVMGCIGKKKTVAMVDTGDVHTLMIGAAGVGKTAYWLYPCIEYACASGMSWLSSDTKGDLARNYGTIAEKYGYHVSVIDLRNPTRSHGNNLLHLVNKYMDAYLECPDQLAYKAKAEKYAKIIAKTIIMSGMDGSSFGDNAYFYDAAEGLLTATILLVAEFCEPQKRHIVSVFKIIQELLAPSQQKGQNQFQQLMSMLPNDHKAKWFAGAALNTSKESMASVMDTALSRLNSFLDSELEQILCFDTEIDAERFCNEKCAVFVILPEENPNSFFMISLIIQQLYREILSVADENGGKLINRCVFFADEFGTIPKIESAEMMFSASRSRRLQIVPIIQSFAQLEKNYGKEGAEIIVDNVQDIIFGGFAPNSKLPRAAKGPMGGYHALSGAVAQVFTGTAYLYVCLKALGGAFGVGSIVQYVGALTALSGGLSLLLSTLGDLKNNTAFLRIVFELLDILNKMHSGYLKTDNHKDQPLEIEFCHVSFKYPGQDSYALRDVSMKFQAGHRLAVVGMNGSGKTTFIKLLCRFYDPTEGAILLNGVDIRKIDYQEYLSMFSVVFQDFRLLSFELGQNVASSVNYDSKKVERCLHDAGFGAQLSKLPDGLSTPLYRDFEEDGIDVSGGEAQKIAIARALYKDAPFIILDEPTAALDPIAEFEIYARMDAMIGERSAVFISHRLSSCRFCQDIAVFHEGQLIQRGAHDVLIGDKAGMYHESWTAQAQYYTSDTP